MTGCFCYSDFILLVIVVAKSSWYYSWKCFVLGGGGVTDICPVTTWVVLCVWCRLIKRQLYYYIYNYAWISKHISASPSCWRGCKVLFGLNLTASWHKKTKREAFLTAIKHYEVMQRLQNIHRGCCIIKLKEICLVFLNWTPAPLYSSQKEILSKSEYYCRI